MTTYPYAGVDTSSYQGNYHPPAGFIIVGAMSDDGGGTPFVQKTYHEQVDNARAAGDEVGHYFFNGGDPKSFAAFCSANLYDFRAGDSVWLDVETQSGGKGPAYSPTQARAFNAEFFQLRGCTPGNYMNISEMQSFDWSPNVAAGELLWLACPSSNNHATTHWPEAAMRQINSNGGIDHDISAYTQAQIRVMQNGSKPKRNDDMQGSAYHGPDGSIYWQEKPGMPLVGLDGDQWKAISANGIVAVDTATAVITRLKTSFGYIPTGTPNLPPAQPVTLTDAQLDELATKLADPIAKQVSTVVPQSFVAGPTPAPTK